MSSVRAEISTGTKDTLEALMVLLSTLQLSSADCANLASNLLSENPDEGGASHAIDSQKSATKGCLPTTKGSLSTTEGSSPIVATTVLTGMITVAVDAVDGYAEVDAAVAAGSILNVHMGMYFNVPMDDKPGVTIYYITRGRKIGVFYGWNNVGPWVQGVSRALFTKVDSVDDGIDIVKSTIEAGVAARV
ncbi:uncharacterized protein HD556DRAFT_1442721 [Suillus plorans]|uniref:Uncharacterized protein n=1 Tax=Suillus plorans TaxID=116603 RepID=A0A9P7AT36_9AGAM|nr:uncharacterized protein HD556DRAFT_1442721 [Suillus plorans]KAG1794533.1 hypothetical protein HD556DRAFT_1442721 [Suillus plorans]